MTEANGWIARWHTEHQGRTVIVDEIIDAAGKKVEIPTQLTLGHAFDLMPRALWEAVRRAWDRSTEPPRVNEAAWWGGVQRSKEAQ